MDEKEHESAGELLRLIMRQTTQSVWILTGRDSDGHNRAMTASSVTPVTLDPATMLTCINQSAQLHDCLRPSAQLTLNLCAAHDRAHLSAARMCADTSRDDERFADESMWTDLGSELPPRLTGAAWLLTDVSTLTTLGSHSVILSRITDGGGPYRQSLTYQAGDYVHP